MPERAYRINVAAERSGVSEQLIRAWERRYGVPRPRRAPGGYRLYTELEIALLRRLKQLTEEGLSIREAVRMAPALRKELSAQPSAAPLAPVATAPAEQLGRWQEAVLQAAQAADQRAVERVLDEAFGALPPMRVYEELVVPLQREVGERWCAGRLTVGQEHLVSQPIRQRLWSLVHAAPADSRKHVVCACFPEEEHEVGMLGAALRFRLAGARVTLLGPRTPVDQLASISRTLLPDVVAVSAVCDPGEARFRELLASIREAIPRGTLLVIGGAAAERYPKICRALKARLISDSEQWSHLLA